MLFWKVKSKEYMRLSIEIKELSLAVKTLELELAMYVRKLKASKGIKELKEEPEDLKKSVLLPDDGKETV